MTAIPFPLSSAPGSRPQEGAGRLINCMAEKLGEGAAFPVRWLRAAGLRQRVNIVDHKHLRGGIVQASTLIAVFDSRAYTITKTNGVYTATNRGELAGTSPVTIAKNNASTPNIVCVDPDNGASNLYVDAAPDDFADADIGQPNSVSELHGYLIFTRGDGYIIATDLNSVSVATNSYTQEQGLNLLRGVSYNNEFYAFGDKWTGVYYDAGSSPFPLDRRTQIPRGIVGTFAIAGWEPGWANQLIWVGNDKITYRLNGYTPEIVSTPDVDRAVAQCADPSKLEASVYMQDGNPIWSLTSPGEWTWAFNAKTQNWHERKSYGRDDWRGSQTVMAFDEWMAGDRTTGKLFGIDPLYYREDDDPLAMTLESGIVAAFPARQSVLRADFNMVAAVGQAAGEDPIQTDPSVLVSWSLDGGYRFGNPVTRKLGRQGVGVQSVSVNRIGQAKGKGVRFRLDVADPVHVALMGGQVQTQMLAA